jgi:hypothetical protein
MALLKDFTDACGIDHKPAYWRLVQNNNDAVGQAIYLTFLGYRDYDAFAGGKSPLLGAHKDYVIKGQEFGQIALAPPDGNTLYDVIANAAEKYALAKKDVDSGRREQISTPVLQPKTEVVQEPEMDINGQPVLDAQGNPVMHGVTKTVLDSNGNPVMVPVLDAQGNPVVNVTQGDPIMVSFFDGATQA